MNLNLSKLNEHILVIKSKDIDISKLAKELLCRARAILLKNHTWFGIFSFQIKYQETLDDSFIMGVGWDKNNIRLLYNPYMVVALAKESIELLCGVLEHEIEHIVRQHIFAPYIHMGDHKFDKYQPLWNVAGDAIINHHLNMTIEGTNYSLIPDVHGVKLSIGQDQYTISDIKRKTIVEVFKELLPKYKDKLTNSGRHIIFVDLDGKEEGSEEQAFLRRKILKGLCDSASKLAGDTPGHLKEYIKELGISHVPYRVLLRRLIGRFYGRPQTTRMRRSRLIHISPFVYPGYNKFGNNKIVFCCDISGSMCQEAFKQTMTELDRASDLVSIKFVTFDSEVQECKEYKKGRWKHIKYTGGGTCFRTLWKFLGEKRLLNLPVFIMTDGFSQWPQSNKNDTFWLMTTDNKAPFGITVPVKIGG